MNPILRTELLKKEPKLLVWKIGDPGSPSRGSSDPDVLYWCEENHFILVTNNRKSMPQHLKDHLAGGGHVPGIIELNPKMGIRKAVDELLLILGASNRDEYQDLILYLPIS